MNGQELDFNELQNILDMVGNVNYEISEEDEIEKINKFLKNKGLPELNEILDVFYEHKPEYKL